MAKTQKVAQRFRIKHPQFQNQITFLKKLPENSKQSKQREADRTQKNQTRKKNEEMKSSNNKKKEHFVPNNNKTNQATEMKTEQKQK